MAGTRVPLTSNFAFAKANDRPSVIRLVHSRPREKSADLRKICVRADSSEENGTASLLSFQRSVAFLRDDYRTEYVILLSFLIIPLDSKLRDHYPQEASLNVTRSLNIQEVSSLVAVTREGGRERERERERVLPVDEESILSAGIGDYRGSDTCNYVAFLILTSRDSS